MLSGVLKPDDKPVSICIHLIVSSCSSNFCFWAPFFRRMRSRQPSGSFDPCSKPRSPLWNTRRRSKVADLLSSHTLTGSGWANPLFTGQFQKKLIVTGRALYLICGHSSLKNCCVRCVTPLYVASVSCFGWPDLSSG